MDLRMMRRNRVRSSGPGLVFHWWKPFSGNIQKLSRILKVVPVEAVVTVPGLGMLGTAPVHPCVAAVAIVEITVRRVRNHDGETAAILRLRFLHCETAFHFVPAYRTNIARYFVLHGGSRLARPAGIAVPGWHGKSPLRGPSFAPDPPDTHECYGSPPPANVMRTVLRETRQSVNQSVSD